MNPTFWAELQGSAALLYLAPFCLLLLCIAIFPLVPAISHHWESNRNKLIVSGLLGAAGVLLYYLPTGDGHRVLHTFLEYGAFIALLASLYIISGGIHISGRFGGFPHVNTLFLALGALLANFLGTTGASVLLIRPLLRANAARKRKTHIVIFFIFVVSNCAGLLTPLGDPPLFMGFLRGVPFDWTLRLFREWALVNGILLALFNFIDSWVFTRENVEDRHDLEMAVAKSERPIHIQGWANVGLLGGVLSVIVVSGYVVAPWAHASGFEAAPLVFQMLALAGVAFWSYKTTAKHIHHDNHFSFGPILEVAALFVGIFGAMIPALAVLEAKAPGLGLTLPWQYYWSSGVLSGFLDNAPTYLTFASVAAGANGFSAEHLGELAAQRPDLLMAISCGSVMMGALSYIGNGPNFMVKAIAEHGHIKMPSFGGYMLWSFGILVPIFLLVTAIFF